MNLLLYINGQLADLDAGQTIAQTKQVNDLNSLDNRQASYTNKFKLPKTANNTKIMQFLTVAGNKSTVPYQKNECSLYSSNGECFVYNGWAVITDGGDDYEAVVYDGIIDLYKAIENLTFANVPLPEIIHIKSLQAVKNSWDNDLNYRYILADYNGDTGNVNLQGYAIVNTDYLVPSVKVSYLWRRIFETFNMQYSGQVFDTENFKNLWLTYPKGLTTTEFNTQVFYAESLGYVKSGWYYLKANEDGYEADGFTTTDGLHLYAQEAGNYRIRLQGNIYPMQNNREFFLGKNAQGLAANQVSVFKAVATVSDDNTAINFDETIYLAQNESICMVLQKTVLGFGLSLTIDKVTATDINFSSSLADFGLRDFLTEIVHRFGLTMFKDKYTNTYQFLTLQELLQTPQTLNWSGKFAKKVSENYIYGSYAQRNWFRYNYDDKEGSFNDGFIDVSNVNLPDAKDVTKSKIYSPEQTPVNYIHKPTNVYKLWEKEITRETNEEGQETDVTTYKSLDKRYYFMRCSNPVIGAVMLQSKQADDLVLTTKYYRESFYKLSFAEVTQEYYNPIRQLLNRSQIITADLWLTDADITGFDFKKLVYIEQLSNYYLVNKINNYVTGKPTRCELVRALTTLPTDFFGTLTITGNESTLLSVRLYFISSYNYTEVQVQYSANAITWTNAVTTLATPVIFDVPAPGLYYFRIIDPITDAISNQISFNV
ncbi:hypothetical protein [Flavobacterium subsaxonicum]|uniref:Uncharacterized protein n=1 Tax=Flavobacterium subsaxonicum WB 4.1-42 = DSM 21790 TaxID=1121898 RepID=A0A0A2MJJ9_9FLAO|nr:hypothetical protein [Flavobacterium subsaxonicum]KGO91741.1 hypothetical protein Q766_15985 [Flavobacterium subsaxonicum WB 4.1-42 = DSM 21790]